MIEPDRCVLLVVDVQNDYCHDEGAFGRAGREMGAIQTAVERLLDVVAAARPANVPIVWVRTEHDRWTDSAAWLGRDVRSAGPICPTGTWGADFYRVAPAPGERVITKHRYSAFVGTPLPVVLRALGRPVLVIAGVTTNVCVESTARDAFMHDWQVVLLADCAAALTKAEHDAAVHNVRTYFGRVAEAATVERAWAEAPRR